MAKPHESEARLPDEDTAKAGKRPSGEARPVHADELSDDDLAIASSGNDTGAAPAVGAPSSPASYRRR